MGNNDSRLTFLNGNINLILDREGATYLAGQQISGRVALRLGEIFYSEKLQVMLRGKVSAKFDLYDYNLTYGEGDIKAETIIHQEILAVNMFDQMRAMPGIYEYPFAIQTPASLPSSFLYCGPQRSFMNIRYELIAGMEDCYGKFKPLLVKRLINLVEASTSIYPGLAISQRNEIFGILHSKGEAAASVALGKAAYHPSESLSLSLQIFN